MLKSSSDLIKTTRSIFTTRAGLCNLDAIKLIKLYELASDNIIKHAA